MLYIYVRNLQIRSFATSPSVIITPLDSFSSQLRLEAIHLATQPLSTQLQWYPWNRNQNKLPSHNYGQNIVLRSVPMHQKGLLARSCSRLTCAVPTYLPCTRKAQLWPLGLFFNKYVANHSTGWSGLSFTSSVIPCVRIIVLETGMRTLVWISGGSSSREV